MSYFTFKFINDVNPIKYTNFRIFRCDHDPWTYFLGKLQDEMISSYNFEQRSCQPQLSNEKRFMCKTWMPVILLPEVLFLPWICTTASSWRSVPIHHEKAVQNPLGERWMEDQFFKKVKHFNVEEISTWYFIETASAFNGTDYKALLKKTMQQG